MRRRVSAAATTAADPGEHQGRAQRRGRGTGARRLPTSPTTRDAATRRGRPASDRSGQSSPNIASSRGVGAAVVGEPGRPEGAGRAGLVMRRSLRGGWRGCGSPSVGLGDLDEAAVELGDPAGDRQAEAGAAVVGGAVVAGGEALEDAGPVLGGDARALVGHLEHGARRRRGGPPRRRCPPGGLCRPALSSRLATSWCRRERSACTARPDGLHPDGVLHGSSASRASRDGVVEERAEATASRRSGMIPASTRDRSSRSVTSRPSRSVWSRAA